MKIEILCTGDEILTGKTINTNHSYIAQRLTEAGLQVYWVTTVGDDRGSLSDAFNLASKRADAVIVNGGLGPTVDDLSQELAAHAAGVELELHKPWLEKLKKFYRSRGRVMPENNIKQAMLPAGSDFIDNPIGTACGFAISIGDSRFYFTPGVPREMRRMINDQVIPKLLLQSGSQVVTRLKRFHSFGIGESRADRLLEGIQNFMPDAVKLGFQSHYPQLETKLAATGSSEAELDTVLKPAEQFIRDRFGNFILCEDDQTLEGTIIALLNQRKSTVATIETATSGNICQRLVNADVSGTVMVEGMVSRNLSHLCDTMGLSNKNVSIDIASAKLIAQHLCQYSRSDYSLVTLINESARQEGDQSETEVIIAIGGEQKVTTRRARLLGGSSWTTLGSTEMALDLLRRELQGLPVDEKTDFEQQ